MKKTLLSFSAALMLSGAALAEPIDPNTSLCLSDTLKAVETNTSYDAFVPTQFLDNARVIEWKAPYSEASDEPVATMVVIEGVGRKRADHNDTDDVTIKCAIDAGVVRNIEIVEGHDVKIVSPMTVSQ